MSVVVLWRGLGAWERRVGRNWVLCYREMG